MCVCVCRREKYNGSFFFVPISISLLVDYVEVDNGEGWARARSDMKWNDKRKSGAEITVESGTSRALHDYLSLYQWMCSFTVLLTLVLLFQLKLHELLQPIYDTSSSCRFFFSMIHCCSFGCFAVFQTGFRRRVVDDCGSRPSFLHSLGRLETRSTVRSFSSLRWIAKRSCWSVDRKRSMTNVGLSINL